MIPITMTFLQRGSRIKGWGGVHFSVWIHDMATDKSPWGLLAVYWQGKGELKYENKESLH